MKKAMSMIVGTAMLVSLLAGCGNNNATANADQAAAEAAAAQEQSQASTVEAWGSVSAETTKELHVSFDGTVSAVYVKEGQEVKQGDKLLSLDYEEYKNSILKKEKELSLDQITLQGQIKSSSGSAQKISNLRSEANNIRQRLANGTDTEIVELQASLTSLKSDLQTAQKDLGAQKELLAAGSATQKDVDDLETKISDLKTKIGTTEQQIENKKKDKEVEVTKINSEIAEVQDSMSETEKSNQTALDSSSIKQEISNLEVQEMKAKYAKSFIKGNDVILDIPKGIIKSVKVVEGSQTGGESNCLLEIIDVDSLIVKANVSEEFIKDIKVGAPVDIVPYADREAVIKGKVKEIENMAVDQNGETVIPIIVEATEASPYLKYGYSVDVEVYTD